MTHPRPSSTLLVTLLGLIVASVSVADEYEDEVLSDEPVVYYRFEEGGLGLVEDASGNDREGEYFGGIEFEQESATECLGQAVLLDGLSGFVQMQPLDLEMDQMTIEVWIRLNALAPGCCTSIFSPDGWQAGWLHYNIKGDANLEFALHSGGPNNHNTLSNTVPFGEWVHLASVYDREEAMVRSYVNGEEVEVIPPTFASPQPVRFNVPAQVGAWQNTRFLGGLMDEFAIYDTALTEDRIRAHFEAATGKIEPEKGIGPFARGDCNQDSSVTISDGVFLLGFLFAQGEAPACAAACDAAGVGPLSISTAIYLFEYLFLGGAPLPPPIECGPSELESDLAHGCENAAACADI